jgi:hypothetical protein
LGHPDTERNRTLTAKPKTFYHYTAFENLDSIKREGLNRGEVPLNPRDCLNAVWLTTDLDPSGHGLTEARELTNEEKLFLGLDPSLKCGFPNKRAVRITVQIPASGFNKLSCWVKWGRKHLSSDWYRCLNETGGNKAHSWFMYWGTIPPEWFRSIELLVSGDTTRPQIESELQAA